MRNKNLVISIPAVVFTLSCRVLSAQTNEEVTVIAPYIPSVTEAAKMPFRPEMPRADQERPVFEYEYLSSFPETRPEPASVEPLKYSANPGERLNRNFLKAGVGNYLTPYIDFMAGSLPSEKYQFGARLKHHSSQGKIQGYPPSSYSHNLLSAAGNIFISKHTLSAGAGYERDVVHFYGFRPDSFPETEFTKDDLRQRFQHAYGQVGLKSNYTDRYSLDHSLDLEAHYFSDLYGTRESEFKFRAGLSKAFKTGSRNFTHAAMLEVGFDYLGYRDTLSSSDPLFINLRPVYIFGSGPYSFEAGLDMNMATMDSKGGSVTGFDVFPLLKASLVIVPEKLKAFAEIAGDRSINSFRSLADANPYIISTPRVAYSDERFRVGGGLTGNVAGIGFQADAYYSYQSDMPLFVNDTSLELQNRFMVIYDDLNVLKLRAGLNYRKGETFFAGLSGRFAHYSPVNESRAWHLPGFEVEMKAGYSFRERYTVKASLLVMGARYAKTWKDGEVVAARLSTAIDPSLGFDYRINDLISAYVEVNNLLNQHYQQWYNYPVQGILVMAGAKLSF